MERSKAERASRLMRGRVAMVMEDIVNSRWPMSLRFVDLMKPGIQYIATATTDIESQEEEVSI